MPGRDPAHLRDEVGPVRPPGLARNVREEVSRLGRVASVQLPTSEAQQDCATLIGAGKVSGTGRRGHR